MPTTSKTDRVLSFLFSPVSSDDPFMTLVGLMVLTAMLFLFLPLLPVVAALWVLDEVLGSPDAQ
ncbi:hypothetical protein [Salarchaeum sp. JOR-1]|uniref:hypothetical protein n=1 Tax=Salarchaeum sp. JOR-1 TaxID=2599399 RepID=UPI00119879AE|nr:hypothetical protein [Salarchaeum sp. JOR-1]QDX41377.1 hypothetical protein FQU85_10880 [Salarchaeum sp. JOR-1]